MSEVGGRFCRPKGHRLAFKPAGLMGENSPLSGPGDRPLDDKFAAVNAGHKQPFLANAEGDIGGGVQVQHRAALAELFAIPAGQIALHRIHQRRTK